MIKLATDENFNGKILRGLLRRQPDIDVVRVQNSHAYQADDLTVLAWAAQENRVLLTHDIRTHNGRFCIPALRTRITNAWIVSGRANCLDKSNH
jgi:predicted nuclease of predicted toxin-antitoxin system